MWQQTNFFILIVTTLAIFIQEVMAVTKLIWHRKVRDQIDTIERLETKLKYIVNDKDQIHNLP